MVILKLKLIKMFGIHAIRWIIFIFVLINMTKILVSRVLMGFHWLKMRYQLQFALITYLNAVNFKLIKKYIQVNLAFAEIQWHKSILV